MIIRSAASKFSNMRSVMDFITRPVIVLKGWREANEDAGVERLLRRYGVSLSEAYDRR